MEQVDFELQPNESAWIECSATGNPPPGVRWSYDEDMPQLYAARSPSGQSSERLVLKSGPGEANAHYQCVANNTINGEEKTDHRSIVVNVVSVTELVKVAGIETEWSPGRIITFIAGVAIFGVGCTGCLIVLVVLVRNDVRQCRRSRTHERQNGY